MARMTGLPHEGFRMQRPKRATVGALRLRLVPNSAGEARLGIAVGKCRTAVERNKIRRRVRELVRPYEERLAGFDISVGAGVEAATLSYESLKADMKRAMGAVLPRQIRRVGREL